MRSAFGGPRADGGPGDDDGPRPGDRVAADRASGRDPHRPGPNFDRPGTDFDCPGHYADGQAGTGCHWRLARQCYTDRRAQAARDPNGRVQAPCDTHRGAEAATDGRAKPAPVGPIIQRQRGLR